MGISNGKPVLRKDDIKLLVKTSGMSEIKVKEAFAVFVSDYPTGQMNVEQFAKHLFTALHAKMERKGGVADIHQIVDFTTKLETHFFRFYDSNNDGFIDFGELVLVFFILAEGTEEDVLKRIFRVYDQNSDGTISRDEMSKLVKDMYGILDMDHPNLDSEALMADTVYTESDVDNDGKVTMDEFIGSCRRQGNLTKFLTNKIVDIFKDSDGDQMLTLNDM
eukprot:GFUD01038373.1.p1 GENE.GFUD01038373.1~~GFUD01038373.1.p1  ORF type:complete len:220 (+),score=81.18 GFUD01038373.1:83-742(+)